MTRSVTDQWGQGRDTILQLLREQHLETIPPNPAHVRDYPSLRGYSRSPAELFRICRYSTYDRSAAHMTARPAS